jgi:chromosome segregation ATPase
VESMNGKPTSALSDAVDYSRILHNGVPQDELESLLREHDHAKQEEIFTLRRQLRELTSGSGGVPPVTSAPDRAGDVRTEITQLRQDLATAMTSIRGLLSDGDGNLHEMQLTSLRRQVSQLEGVLESNYQRELRVAEERESALRSEMAQMRQDLRVALETLYGMPAEEAAANGSVDLKPIEDQITELGASLFRVSHEQQAQALEREGTLKAELAHMRRDLLVTLEASYQLPTDRVEALDTQIASWRGQVEDLQQVIRGMQEAQNEAATRQLSARQDELHELRQEIRTTLVASLPESENEELFAQRTILNGLAERLDQQVSETGSRFTQLSELVSGRSVALETEYETLRADVQSVAHSTGNGQVLELLNQREQSLSQEIATLQRELATIVQAVTAPSSDPVDHSTDLQALRQAVAALADELSGSREEQRSLLEAQRQSLQQELAASHDAVLEAASAIRDFRPEGVALTAEAFDEMIGVRLGDAQSHWSEAQTQLYRQLVSQMSEMQADLDLVNTGMQAMKPIENDHSEVESSLLEKVDRMLELQRKPDHEDRESTVTNVIAELRREIQEVRADLRAGLQERATEGDERAVAALDFSLDDVARAVSAQLLNDRGERDRLAADRDAMLFHEIVQIRHEVQGAVQQVLASTSSDQTVDSAVGLSSLRSELAEIHESVTRIPDSHAELTRLRQDLHSALDMLRAEPAPQERDYADASDSLAPRIAELELALQRSREDQQRWMEERDEKLYSQLREMRANLSATFSESRAAQAEVVNDSWHDDLAELRSEIAALTELSRTPEVHDDSAIIDMIAGVRSEMREALEAVRISDSESGATPSDPPAIQGGLTALAISIQQATANQNRMVESQQQTLQAAVAQMREEIHSAVSALTRENVDSFEKRQSQLRMDQLEMERNLAQLRQELVATQTDPGNKKKLWR